MTVIATNRGGDFNSVPLPKEGNYPSRCFRLILIGTVPNIYQGQDQGMTEKIWIDFELPTQLAVFSEEKGEQPFVVGIELTNSTSPKANLSKLISAMRNRPLTDKEQKAFDISVIINKPCLVSVTHKRKKAFIGKEIEAVTNENTHLNFNGVSSVPEGMSVPKAMNELTEINYDNFDIEKFNKLPKFLQDKMRLSEEFKMLNISDSQDETIQTGPDSANSRDKVDEDEW